MNVSSVTVIGLEMLLVTRKPNGIRCDECGRQENFDRRESDAALARLREEGWVIPTHCPDCAKKDAK